VILGLVLVWWLIQPAGEVDPDRAPRPPDTKPAPTKPAPPKRP